ncbi:hypothetical protein LJC27_06880 [Christensenellaceae bacterium OttesenSCG-928-M15]|nr:hypothetical protein [Christensenellaceae bacterium OttesenSCG-928-M15]
MSWFIVVIQAAVAAYLIYTAIRGKSKLFNSPYIKEGMEEKYKKTGRVGVLIIAGALIVVAILNVLVNVKLEDVQTYLADNNIVLTAMEDMPAAILPVYETASSLYSVAQVMTAVVLTGLLALFFIMSRMQDKTKKREAAVRHSAPRAAFYFDDEEDAAKK